MVQPGDRVAERYQAIEQLASGGMGVVWRGRHLELDVDVALKFMHADAAHPEVLERFRREAKVVARLNSPNIVRVLDSGVVDGQPFFVMELLRGENLAQSLAREGKLPVERCAQLLDSVAKALQCAHDAGIVHRDLKPSNVFLETAGSEEIVKILDFGVAKDLRGAVGANAATASGVVLGSPGYRTGLGGGRRCSQ